MIDPATEGWKKHDGKGFLGLVGPLWSRREDDHWAYAFVASEQHVNAAGVVHGGLLVSLADQAMSMVVWEAMDRAPCVTVQLDTHFLMATRPGDFIQARARVARATRSLAFAQASLAVGDEPVLLASGVWKVTAPARGADTPRS